MKPTFVGIAGGTGAGKSTLCAALVDKYPDKIGLIQLDDYFKPPGQAPTLAGHSNWDHPDALFLNTLANDMAELSQGRTVTIYTKNELLNPDYKKTEKRIPVTFHPKPILLVEGYLVLHDARVRRFFSSSIWLDVDHDTRWARRVHFKYPEYEQKILRPMHAKFVEPTKKYATHVIDVASLTKEQVQKNAEEIIQEYL